MPAIVSRDLDRRSCSRNRKTCFRFLFIQTLAASSSQSSWFARASQSSGQARVSASRHPGSTENRTWPSVPTNTTPGVGADAAHSQPFSAQNSTSQRKAWAQDFSFELDQLHVKTENKDKEKGGQFNISNSVPTLLHSGASSVTSQAQRDRIYLQHTDIPT